MILYQIDLIRSLLIEYTVVRRTQSPQRTNRVNWVLFTLSIFIKEFILKPFYLNQKKFYPILVFLLIVIGIQVTGYADVTLVSERTPEVRDAIIAAVDGVNAASDVTDTHLAAITSLDLRAEGITALKAGDFEGLSALTHLNLYGNQLSSLPDGIFEGLTALTTLRLGGNTVNPMLITVSLEKVGNGQFKAVARTGAPFAIVLPISAVNGSISENATTVTIPKGSVESEALTITRTDDTTDAVTVDIGTLPGLPSNHYGYTFSKSDTEALEVIGGVVSDETETETETEPEPEPDSEPEPDPEPDPPANSAPAFSDGATTIRTIAENTDAGENIGTAVAAIDTNSGDTLTYTLGGTDAASFDINATIGQLKTKTALDYETKRVYAVTITVSDGSLTDTITVLISVIDIDDTVLVSTLVAVSDRTPEVRDAIVAAVPNIGDAGDVTDTHLAAITELNLRAMGITTLEMGDFSGLTGLTNLNLYGNMLNRLPMGIFDGLTALTTLRLGGNLVDPMPLIVSLQQVDANQYQAIIPAGAPFDIVVPIDATTVTIPQGSMKSDAFTVTGVPVIGALPMLPANHFGYTFSKSTACNCTSQVAAAIAVAVPGVTDCQNVTEIDIASITALDLSNKSITSLRADDFAGLLSLTTLDLRNNQLSNLPDGIFSGLTSLTTLQLAGNTVAPLTISLLKVGENQFKAVLPTGAPFAINLSVLIKTGNVASGAITVTIPQGSMESQLRTVTRAAGTTAAVTVDIGTMPSLPAMHSGYTFAKSANLPLEILESINVAPVFTDGSTTTRSIAENTAASINIGSAVAATDANNDTLTYTLSGDPDAAAFDIVSTTGQLQTKVALDFETKTSYSVIVTVSDSILTDTITVTINVTDKSELPSTDDAESETVTNNAPVFSEGSSATRSVAENTGSGVDIGSPISATDDDDDTLGYSLGGINAGSFTIDTTTGQLRTNAALDFETKSSYTVEVTVSDSTDTVTITVTINVTDVDETPANNAPTFTEGSNATRSVAENTGSGVDIGSAVSVTDDDNDTLSYTLGGTDASSFSIDSSSGQLRTSAALDFETKDFYSVTITVSDGKGGSATITVTINITNVDETPANNAPTFTEEGSATRSIAENTGSGVDIGSAVSATDDDNDTLTYTLSGTDASSFSIDSSSGQLRTSVALDFETKDTYSVTISVSDGKGGSDTITVTINITNVEEALANNDPVFTEDSNITRSIAENTGSGVDIGSAVSATDADNDTLTYRLEGTDASSFSIDSSSGQLQTSATLDYETKSSYSVTITVSDGNGGSDSITVTINVTNVNESPVFTDGTSTARSIAENAPAGINIGTAVAATDDDGDTLTYTLGGTNAAAFDIEAETGQLKTKASLDFETKSSYTVTVAVSDSKGGTDSITVTVNVTDLDETPSNNPPVFTAGDDPITRAVAENMPAGTDVGDPVSATDADENTLAYLLSGDDASAFSIDDDGQLKTSAPLNHEVKSSYTVTITVSDGGLTDTINVTISVTDANDAPVFNKKLPTTLSIAENTAAANIGDAFTATDEDGDTLTYSIQTLTDVTPFRIDTSNGQLQTLRPLDFEEETSYTVTIAVEDDNGGSDEIKVTINVTDVDENAAPVFTDGDRTTREVAENTGAGVNIGNPVAATDADEDNLEYTLGGDDADAFDIGSTTGQLRTKSPLDFETKDSYEVTVTVSDGNGGSAEIEVAITITDVDENIAPVFTDGDRTTREVAENTGSGVNIGTPIAATDADEDNLEYTLGGDDADAFDIGSTTGQLRTKAPLDFETKDSYEVTVTVSDGNGGSAEIEVAITITDVDENIAPVFSDGDSTTRSIAENTGSGANIGNPVAATDANNDNLTYSLSGTDAAAFSINTANGQLRTHAALDYETDDSYSVSIMVRDGNGGSDEIAVTISVTDENEAPVFTVGDSTTREVAENTAAGENIGSAVSATDVDNDDLTYTLSGTDAASFSIVSGTGQLQTSAALDYETDDTYSVTITVSDGSLTDSISVTINITDVDENRAPEFSDGTSATRSVAENTGAGENIGAPVAATDADNNTLTYTLGGTNASSFSIDSGTGQLKTSAALDYETKDSYSVTITVSDGNGGSDSITVTINVTDIAENVAPVFSDGTGTTRSVAENTASGENIGAAVAATDANTGDMLTYSLGGTDASSFSIVGTTGQLQTSAALDFETDPSYTVTVSVSDGNGGTDSITVTITVLDVPLDVVENRAPRFSDGASTTRSVAENTDSGVDIGRAVTAMDADNDTLTYSLRGTDRSSFSIVGTTGQLRTRAALDFETDPSYSVIVYVSDGNRNSDSINVTINVIDVDEEVTVNVIDEGENTITVIDEDESYLISGRTQQVQDAIVAAVTGVDSAADVTEEHLSKIQSLVLANKSITSLKSEDFSGMSSLKRLYLSKNNLTSLPEGVFDGLSSLQYLTLNNNSFTSLSAGVFEDLSSLTNLNLHGKNTSLSEGVFDGLSSLTDLTFNVSDPSTSLPEDLLDGLSSLKSLGLYYSGRTLPEELFDGLSSLKSLLIHGQVSSLESDIFEGLSSLRTLMILGYQLTSLPGDVFDGLSSLRTLKLQGDFTSLSSEIFAGLSSLTSLHLTVNHRAPHLSNLPAGIFAGLSSLTSLALPSDFLSSLPEDIFDDLSSLTTLDLSGNQISDLSELVHLTSLTTLYVSGNPISDYGPLHRLKVQNPNISIDIEIPSSVGNSAPVFSEGDSTTRSVAENTASGVDIGTAVAATDTDGDTLTYSLGGTNASTFSIVSTSGQLQTKSALDYETKNSYSVTVSVSDGKGGSDSIAVTINVTNVNDAPEFSDGSSTTRSVAENTASGENIGSAVSATDADNNTLTYTLSGMDASSFSIVGTTGQLQTKSALDHETKASYSVTVSVSDGNSGTDSITVTIKITNVNDAPEFSNGSSTTRSVDENAASGENIGSAVAATDEDGDTLTYTLGGTNSDAFSIVGTTGQLQTKNALDHETKDSYEVTITVSDGNGGSDSITVTINVTDVSEVVLNAIVAAAGVSSAADLTAEHFAAITNLDLSNKSITSLKADDFDGLTALTTLDLSDNNLSALPSGIFDELTSLKYLYLSNNSLTALPSGVFDKLTSLKTLFLRNNSLTALPSGVFDKLTRLQTLKLKDNSLTALPSGIFEKLTRLQFLDLDNNSFSTLPSGIFEKLASSIFVVEMSGNTVDPLPLTVSLSKVSAGQFKAVAPAGAPFNIVVPITVTNGSMSGSATSVTISRGALESSTATVTRTTGTTAAVTVNIGTLPGIRSADSGYELVKPSTGLPLTVIDATSDNPNNAPEFTDGSNTTRSVAENTASGENIGTAISATDVDNNTLTYTLGGTDAASFSIVSTTGQLQTKSALDYETKTSYSVTVSVSDGNGSTDSITVTINITDVDGDYPLAGRTQKVQDTIVAAVTGADSAADVTAEHLAGIKTLNLSKQSIATLKAGDFNGLTALKELDLSKNSLSSLSAGIFDRLTALKELNLSKNSLSSLSAGIFDGLTALKELDLSKNSLSSLSAGIFDGLTALEGLNLGNNSLSSLSADIFSKLTKLEFLYLDNNGLSSLPDGIFNKLTALEELWLNDNSVDPIPITVSLKKVAEGEFKVTVPIGTPVEIEVPLTATNGDISSTTVTMSIGSVESESLTVTRTAGTTGSVTVDIGTLSVKSDLFWYPGCTIVKSADLPLEVIAAVNGAPQSTKGTVPVSTALLPNYPNPSNPETWIPYQLAKPADVSLTIYNVRGVVVRQLKLGHQQAGIYYNRSRAAHWDGKNGFGESVASDVYFYMFKAGKYTAIRRMLIRK